MCMLLVEDGPLGMYVVVVKIGVVLEMKRKKVGKVAFIIFWVKLDQTSVVSRPPTVTTRSQAQFPMTPDDD